MDLYCILKYLQDNGVGTMGVDIFQFNMPSNVLKGLLVRQPMYGIDHDPYCPGFYKTEIQLIARAQRFDTGHDLIVQGRDILETRGDRALNDQNDTLYMTIRHMVPKTLPIHYPRSEDGGIEWSVRFDTAFVLH